MPVRLASFKIWHSASLSREVALVELPGLFENMEQWPRGRAQGGHTRDRSELLPP